MRVTLYYGSLLTDRQIADAYLYAHGMLQLNEHHQLLTNMLVLLIIWEDPRTHFLCSLYHTVDILIKRRDSGSILDLNSMAGQVFVQVLVAIVF